MEQLIKLAAEVHLLSLLLQFSHPQSIINELLVACYFARLLQTYLCEFA